MSRKRKSGLSDSLDMLLDTITNTFGGILLITMLLVLQVRKTEVSETGPEVEDRLTVEQAETLQAELAALNTKKESLEDSLKLQTEMTSQFGDPAKQAIAGDLSSLLSEINSLRKKKSQMTEQMSVVSSEAQSLKEHQAQKERDLNALKNTLVNMQAEVQVERERRTRTMEMPKEQVTAKDMNPVFLTDEGFFVVDKGRALGLNLNAAQFQKASEVTADIIWDGTPYKMRPGTGYEARVEIIRDALAGAPPGDNYLLVCCRTDSFEKFAEYKEIFVDLGYEYRLVPGDEAITISYGRGKPQKAQ